MSLSLAGVMLTVHCVWLGPIVIRTWAFPARVVASVTSAHFPSPCIAVVDWMTVLVPPRRLLDGSHSSLSSRDLAQFMPVPLFPHNCYILLSKSLQIMMYIAIFITGEQNFFRPVRNFKSQWRTMCVLLYRACCTYYAQYNVTRCDCM